MQAMEVAAAAAEDRVARLTARLAEQQGARSAGEQLGVPPADKQQGLPSVGKKQKQVSTVKSGACGYTA